MPNALTDLTVEYVSLVDRAAVRDPQNPTEPQKFLVWKSDSGATPDPTGGTMTEDELRAAVTKAEQERDEAREAAQKAETEREAALAKAADLEKAAKPEDKPEAIDKAELPEPVRLALEKAEADAAAANQRIEKAENLAKAEREIRVTREFVAKAAEYKALPVEADAFGPVLKAASESLTADAYAELDRVLKAADAQIASSELLKEAGAAGDGPTPASDETLVAKAQEIRKADSSVSEAKAMERAMRENPELAASYLASVR